MNNVSAISKPGTSRAALMAAALCLALGLALSLHAQGAGKNNPAGKVYFADVSGDAQIQDGGNIQDLAKRSVYRAQGMVIETKKAATQDARDQNYATMVYSNGTAARLGQDTRIEIKKFVQEPFKPNRTDMDVEPSISHTEAFVAHGSVAVTASTLVAGSSMTYQTRHCTVNVRGKKVVIETDDNETTISMLEGDGTLRAGDLDLGGHILKAGEQAIIRPGGPGQPNIVEVRPIPSSLLTALRDWVDAASMARKTVYFEVRERSGSASTGPGSSKDTSIATAGTEDSTASGGDNTPVTTFDGAVANSSSANSASTRQEIFPIEVVPGNLPVQFTVSPARLISPTPGSGK